MKEFDFIQGLISKNNLIELSIGDDAACFNDILIAKDIMVQDIHFTLKAPLEYIIFKLFTANVSDIAAMGGIAENILLGLAIPDFIDKSELVSAIKKATNFYGLNLIGGDTTSSKDKLFLSLTITGKKGKYLLKRSGAQAGDIMCLSRPTGLSKLSLIQELEGKDCGLAPFSHYLMKAETDLGQLLGNTFGITSCIDISDGLSSELHHIAKQSRVKIVVDKEKLPLNMLNNYTDDTLSYCLESGEEFALLFTVKKNLFQSVKKLILKELKVEIIDIGNIFNGEPKVLLKDEDMVTPLLNLGYEHNI